MNRFWSLLPSLIVPICQIHSPTLDFLVSPAQWLRAACMTTSNIMCSPQCSTIPSLMSSSAASAFVLVVSSSISTLCQTPLGCLGFCRVLPAFLQSWSSFLPFCRMPVCRVLSLLGVFVASSFAGWRVLPSEFVSGRQGGLGRVSTGVLACL